MLVKLWIKRFIGIPKRLDQTIFATMLASLRNGAISGPIQEYNLSPLERRRGVKKIYKIRFYDPYLIPLGGFVRREEFRRRAAMLVGEKGITDPYLVHWAAVVPRMKIALIRSINLWYPNEDGTRCSTGVQRDIFSLWRWNWTGSQSPYFRNSTLRRR
jgi:hypothetical protein